MPIITFKYIVLQKLQTYLLSREAEPIMDAANIIIPNGVTAAATIQAIKDCIKIVKGTNNESTSEDT